MTRNGLKNALVQMLEKREDGTSEFDRMMKYAATDEERADIEEDENLAEMVAENPSMPIIPIVMGIKSVTTWQDAFFYMLEK